MKRSKWMFENGARDGKIDVWKSDTFFSTIYGFDASDSNGEIDWATVVVMMAAVRVVKNCFVNALMFVGTVSLFHVQLNYKRKKWEDTHKYTERAHINWINSQYEQTIVATPQFKQ